MPERELPKTFDDVDEDNLVLVCAKYQSRIMWFCSERDYWMLNWPGEDLLAKDRGGPSEITAETIPSFLKAMEVEEVSETQLRQKFSEFCKEPRPFSRELIWYAGFFIPHVWVDFDESLLVNCYENTAFHNIVPAGWKGIWEDTTEYIPESHHAWCVKEGNFLEILREEDERASALFHEGWLPEE